MKEFDKLDKDENGTLSKKEILPALMSACMIEDEYKADFIFIIYAGDDKRLDRSEYMELWNKMCP